MSHKINTARAALSGVRWNYFGGFASTICSLVIGIVLARILGPKPYGQTIIATIIYGFMNLFVDGGFSSALIQKSTLEEIEVQKTFTFQVIIGLCSSLIIITLAPWVAFWFHDPSAESVIKAMSLMMTFQSLGLVSAALLRRSMRFKVIQYSALSSYLIGYCVIGIPLAIYGAGVWSLVAAYLAQSLLNSIFLYSSARHSLTPVFGWPGREIGQFGGFIIANNIVNWGHSNFDNLSVSSLGPKSLGLYGRACNFAYQPVNFLANGLQTVLLPTAARLKEDSRMVHDVTLSVMGIAFGVLGVIYATIAIVPTTIIVGLYGTKWVEAIPILVPLAIAMPFYGAHCLLGPIVCGLGRPNLEFWPQMVSSGVALLAYSIAAHYSVVCVSWTLLGVMVFRLVLICLFAFRLIGISWANVSYLLLKRIGISMIFAATIWLIDQLMGMLAFGPFVRLCGLILASIGLLAAVVWWASDVLFGRFAVSFMLSYGAHLPAKYTERLRSRVSSVASQ